MGRVKNSRPCMSVATGRLAVKGKLIQSELMCDRKTDYPLLQILDRKFSAVIRVHSTVRKITSRLNLFFESKLFSISRQVGLERNDC
jgi:hypothetical protein